jgi:hypothetical protein
MTVDAGVTSAPSTSTLTAAADYLGLTAEQRYAVISEKSQRGCLLSQSFAQGMTGPMGGHVVSRDARGRQPTCSCSSCAGVTPISTEK